jgi:hypothetical protein
MQRKIEMSELTSDQLMEQFANATLPEQEFTHAGHVKMAFLYLCRYRVTDVLERFPVDLSRYAAARGKAGLYHETITWAFIFLIHERMGRMGSKPDWEEFARSNADLLKGGKKYLEKFYREETIASEFAKKTFVFPDRQINSME